MEQVLYTEQDFEKVRELFNPMVIPSIGIGVLNTAEDQYNVLMNSYIDMRIVSKEETLKGMQNIYQKSLIMELIPLPVFISIMILSINKYFGNERKLHIGKDLCTAYLYFKHFLREFWEVKDLETANQFLFQKEATTIRVSGFFANYVKERLPKNEYDSFCDFIFDEVITKNKEIYPFRSMLANFFYLLLEIDSK